MAVPREKTLPIDHAFSHMLVRLRGETSVQAWFRQHARGMGKGLDSRASYDKLEKAGRGPTQREYDYFIGLGGPPTDEDRAAGSLGDIAPPDLVATLAALTTEVAAMRRERVALWRGLAFALRAPEGERVAAILRDALEPLLPAQLPPSPANGGRSK